MNNYLNGRIVHFYPDMIHMASFILGMDTYYQKVVIPTFSFQIPAILVQL